MQEHHVTVGGQTYPLPGPFFVLATQNPLEMEGTYPLPEAQLDRFFYKLLVQFPTFHQMESILDRTTEATKPQAQPIFGGERILSLSALVRQIPIAPEVRRYAIAVVMATHPDDGLAAPMTRQFVRYGSSPRGAQAIILAAKLKAILDGRYHVAREDIRAVAPMALRHRLILNFEGQAEGIPTDAVVENILKTAKEPSLVAV
jgi:MoxR-like ATPase